MGPYNFAAGLIAGMLTPEEKSEDDMGRELSWTQKRLDELEPGSFFEAYGVFSNTDMMEGKGSEVLLFVCGTMDTAREKAIGQGVNGTDADIKLVDMVKTRSGDFYPVVGNSRTIHLISEETIRKNALAKLTPEERKVLGV